MNSVEVVHTFIENAVAKGVEFAKAELFRQRDFLVIDAADVELAIAHSVEEARGSKTERRGYAVVIALGIAALALNGCALLFSTRLSGIMPYVLCGVSAGAIVLIWQYTKYLRDLALNQNRVGAICRELKQTLNQLHKAG